MVAQTHEDGGQVDDSQSTGAVDESEARFDEHGRPSRGGLRHLIREATKLVDLQYRIWLTQAKLTMMRIAISGGLLIGAAVLGVLAVIFLSMGVFHVLTEVLKLPKWAAYLIFDGGLGLIAGILILIATRMLTRTETHDEKEGSK